MARKKKYPTNIVAYDPGKTVGVARYVSHDNNKTGTFVTRIWMWDGFDHDQNVPDAILWHLKEEIDDADIVIIENYLVDPRYGVINPGKPVWAAEVKGALMLACKMSGTPFILQHPSKQAMAKQHVIQRLTGHRLNARGNYGKRLKTKHEESALKHLTFYMMQIQHPFFVARMRSDTD